MENKFQLYDQRILKKLNHFLEIEDNKNIEKIINENIEKNILGDNAFNKARSLKLIPLVMFLASLGDANLAEPNDRLLWLELYKSLVDGRETEIFKKLENWVPVKFVFNAILNKKPALPSYPLATDIHLWVPAIELMIDFEQEELLGLVFSSSLIETWRAADWLLITKVFVHRLGSLRREKYPKIFEEIFGKIYKNIKIIDEVKDAQEFVALILSETYGFSGNFEEAILYSKSIRKKEFLLRKNNILTTAYWHIGDKEKAIEQADELIKMLINSETLEEVLIINKSEKKSEDYIDFDTQGAAEALVDFQNVLSKIDQKAFIMAGTLLGFYRDKNLLKHDKDIDVGVFGWENQYQIITELLASGLFSFAGAHKLRMDKTYLTSVVHIKKNIPIDIFFWRKNNEKSIVGIDFSSSKNQNGLLIEYAHTTFDLQEIDFFGVKFFAPDDISLYLKEAYGNWGESDPYFLAQIEGPAMIDKGSLSHQYAIRIQLQLAIAHTNLGKIDRCLQVADKYKNYPMGFSDEMFQVVRKIQKKLVERRNKMNRDDAVELD